MQTSRRTAIGAAFLLSVVIAAQFVVTPTAAPRALTMPEAVNSLPEATAGGNYEHHFQAEGGLPPLAWNLKQGELPPGLTLDATGRLHGTPTQPRREPYQFTIEVSDSARPPQSFAQEFTLAIQPAPLRIIATRPPLRILNMNMLQDPAPRPDQNAAPPAGKNDAKDVTKKLAEDGAKATKNNAAADEETPKNSYIVRGRVRPAALDEVFAVIQRNIVTGAAHLPDDKREEIKPKVADVQAHLCGAGFRQHCFPPLNADLDETHEDRRKQERREEGRKKLSAVNLLNYIRYDKELLPMFEAKDSAHPPLSRDTLDKLALMLNSYIDNIPVRVKVGDKIVATTATDKDGVYELTLPESNTSEVYVFSTAADNHLTQREVVINDGSLACLPPKGRGKRVRLAADDEADCRDFKVNLPIEDGPVSLLTRAVVGYQQAGASSSDVEHNYFLDLFISKSLPFRQKINPDFGERWRAWGAIRAISAPQSGNVTIGELGRDFAAKISGLPVNEAARVFDYLGGVEARLPWLNNNALRPAFSRDSRQKFSLSFIASFGFITPTNPTQTAKTFEISDQLRAEYATRYQDRPAENPLSGKTYVSFVQSDRDRFFRQGYAGVRMQTFFFNEHNVPLQRFPAQLDVLYGVNEYVTGGSVRGGVMRLDGYFPLPYEGAKFISLFGTAIFKPVRAKIEAPLILKPADAMVQPYDPRAALVPISQFNRDYYRVGVGIDFVSFVGKLLGNN